MTIKTNYLLLGASLLLCTVAFFTWWLYPVSNTTKFHATTFKNLPGWKSGEIQTSLQAFQISCKTFLRQHPEKQVGSKHIDLKIKDWQPACKAALAVPANSNQAARAFFETWFTPVAFHKGKPVRGLFTGYYMPYLKGSLTKTATYNVPIYSVPSNLVTADPKLFDSKLKHHRKFVGQVQKKKLLPYYTRAQINKGAINKFSSVIVWINDPVERQFLEIEGSGIVQLPDGKKMYIGYAGENGAPYTSIAQILINKGVMTRDNASMQRIRRYFKQHPKQVNAILNQNKSFVFFEALKQEAALGAQGVPLTAGYSLAIDRKWIPMGAPIWLSTTSPDKATKKENKLQRLMIAQDTGGAIQGKVRGDVYWGDGDEAVYTAGHMKNPGYYWILLPKTLAANLHNRRIL
jgi:membrane-bound lytic murein transglycosylase A